MLSMFLPRRVRFLAAPALLLLLVTVLGAGLRAGGEAPSAHASAHQSATIEDLQALFFVWASGTLKSVLVTDVGPWNEDDNSWDANGTSATQLANCPVSSTLIAPDATSNALVDGICPNGTNLRRIYYYLLYQHYGLPFFQAGGYAPSGSFQDGSAWPTALGLYCAEASAASINSDGVMCYGSPTNYNSHNGGWLRAGTYDGPILNQSSIDLSPGVNKALGWVYPSSGLVLASVSGLP